MFHLDAGHPILAAEAVSDRTQIESAIREMKSDDGIWPAEMPEVEGHGLFSEKVHRNRVAAEGVEDEQVKFLELAAGRFPFERKAGVVEDNVHFGGGILEEGEPGFCA